MRILVVALLACVLMSCSSHSEKWYLQHPGEMQKALAACPDHSPNGVSCRQLMVLNQVLTKYAAKLQASPQAFGQEIIALQNTINALEEKVHTASQTDKQASLRQLKQLREQLHVYMTTVRMFESPGE